MVRVAPSILAADWTILAEEVRAIESTGAEVLHLDVMDGSFVPPISFGADFVRAVRRLTALPLDVHLMIDNPERHLEDFAAAGTTNLTVHVEACRHLHRVVQRIKELGMTAGVALNPATPVSHVAEIVREIDLLLIMTVNPGFGGQKFIAGSEAKIAAAASLIAKHGNVGADREVIIEVDGGVNETTAKVCVAAGATQLVAGSYVFQKRGAYAEAVQALR